MKTRGGWQRTRLALVGFVAAWTLLLAGAGWAQDARVSPQGIPYVSGGVGDDERAIMNSLAGRYNLSLEFAQTGGNFLGDVRVILRGPVSLDALSDGPLFLVKLPAGTYNLTAVADGVAKTRTVVITGNKLQSIALFW